MLTQAQATAGSPKDKTHYLQSLYIPHRNLLETLSEVRRCMSSGQGLSLALVVGPPGVGKTTLGRLQLRDLLRQFQVQLQEDPAIIPAVMCELDPPLRGSEINLALLYARLCTALLAPSAFDGFGMPSDRQQIADPVKGGQFMFETAAHARRLEYLILDEMVHFVHSTTDPIHYSDFIKSLTNRSGFNFLGLGAYGCEVLAVATGEMPRRVEVIHYERYKETDSDVEEYFTFVKSVAAALPYRVEVDVSRKLEYLFEGTFGLPGLTVDVLTKAASRCFLEKYPRWKDEFLFKAMPSKAAQRKLVISTIQGERDIEPYLQNRKEIAYLTESDARHAILTEEELRKSLNAKRHV